MKRLTIGRSNDCDVVIIDETDNISRKHLVISFNFFGKMSVSDTSSNGTFINGTRMLKGATIPVTTNDTIRLGNKIDLDWSLIKDPYKTVRIVSLIALVMVLAIILCLGGWQLYNEKIKEKETPKVELISTDIKTDDSWNQDSTNKVAPIVNSIDIEKGKKNTINSKSNRKKSSGKKVSNTKNAYNKEEILMIESSEADSVAAF